MCQVGFLDQEVETVCEMYKLIESYSVPTPPEDLAVFGTLRPSRSLMNNTIDKAVGERDANVAKFCQHLQQDIKELTNEVMRIKQQAEVRPLIHSLTCISQFIKVTTLIIFFLDFQNRLILDIDANRDQVRTLLGEIQHSIDELQEQAFRYKSYQKNFKVRINVKAFT